MTRFSAMLGAILGALAGTVAVLALDGLDLVAPSFAKPASAAEPAPAEALAEEHRGVDLVATPVKPGARYDVAILGQREGLARLRDGLDLIQRTSPTAVKALETLKAAGRVTVVYDPNFAKEGPGGFVAAAFLPEFFKRESERASDRVFLVLISRHGIKWPLAELAAVLVHELVGHAMQRLEGRSDTMRELDFECEAWLYEEMAYQNFGVDKSSHEMIGFRRQLEDHFCSDFRRHLRATAPAMDKLFDVRDPDVPRLLALFRAYQRHLAETGQAAKAVAAAQRLRAVEIDRLFRDGTPDQLHAVALSYRDGLGVPRDLALAARWLERAAEQGHAASQVDLAALYGAGRGVAADRVQAYMWLALAAARGDADAAKARDELARLMTQAQVAEAERRADAWRPRPR